MNILLTRATTSILLVFAFVLISNAAERPQSVKVADDPILSNKIPSEAQLGALKSLGKGVNIDWNKENATPIFLYGNLSSTKSASSAEAAAIQFLSANSALFKLKSPAKELRVHSQEGDELGYTHIKYDQQINGVPVWGSQLGVHINNSGEIYCVSGNYHPTVEISTVPAVTELAARQAAMDDLKKTDTRPIDSRATLVIFPGKEMYFLCWNVEVFGTQPNDIYWQYFVDAITSEIVFKYNDIQYDGPAVGSGKGQDGYSYTINTYLENGHYRMVDATKQMYVPPIGNRTGVIVTRTALNDTLGGTLYGPIEFGDDFDNDNVFDDLPAYYAGVDAHRNFGKVYDFFLSRFSRSSWDGTGSSIKSNVHYGQYEISAFWSGYWGQFYFGDGVPSFWGFSYATDVVAHEFTHAVTQTTAGLKYYGQSGALNESMSDVFACMIDSTDWTLGEEMVTPAPGYIRNMQNPHLGYNPSPYSFGAQPMTMSEYDWFAVLTGDDNGGVHGNSGIPNHAAYLVASQIGRYKMGRIFYRALSNYLYPTSNFLNAYYATWISANDYYGAGTERAAIEYAFDSVQVAPNADEWNLRVDDGFPGNSYYWSVANRGLAAEFYLPGSVKILQLSFYILGDHAGGNASFGLKVFPDSSGKPKGSPIFDAQATVPPSLPNWIVYDLSANNLRVSNKMYVAMFYDGVNQPLLGFDTSSTWQSWYYNGSSWVSESAVYFVRAKVSTVTDAGDELTMDLPSDFALDQNYPNPFNNSTLITYSVPRPSPVSFEVLNILGQVVASEDLGVKQPGVYSRSWDGTDGGGKVVPSGVYFYRVKSGDLTQTKKMVLLK